MMRCYKLLILLAIILIPAKANALMCSNQDKVKFQKMAKNITTTYDYIEENGTVAFTVTLSNVPNDFVIQHLASDQEYRTENGEIVFNNMAAGTSYRFDVYTSDEACFLERLYSIYVNLPSYNPYYNDPICEGIENYKFCNKWQQVNLTYDEFVKEVNRYKASLKQPEKKEEVKGFFEKIIDFCMKYPYIVIPIFILLIGLCIYVYNKP